jgi:hypothetical protein
MSTCCVVSMTIQLSSLSMSSPDHAPLGGRILITGIGQVDEDEFMLNLLNEQVKYMAHNAPGAYWVS